MNYSLSCFHSIYIMSVSRSTQCTFTSSCVNAAADHKYFTYFTNEYMVEWRDIFGHNACRKPFDLRPWTWRDFFEIWKRGVWRLTSQHLPTLSVYAVTCKYFLTQIRTSFCGKHISGIRAISVDVLYEWNISFVCYGSFLFPFFHFFLTSSS